MWARRTTTRVWRARGDHHERTITRKDAAGKLIRKINLGEGARFSRLARPSVLAAFARSAALPVSLRRKELEQCYGMTSQPVVSCAQSGKRLKSSPLLSLNHKHILTWHFLSRSDGGADPSPSHSCGEPLYAPGGASVQDGTLQGWHSRSVGPILMTAACASKRQRLAVVKFCNPSHQFISLAN